MGEYMCECVSNDRTCASRLETPGLAGTLERALEVCGVSRCMCWPASAAPVAFVRVRYPAPLRDRALEVASVFESPEIGVELVEDRVSEIVIEGPTFATTDTTRATAMLRRYLIAIEKRNRG